MTQLKPPTHSIICAWNVQPQHTFGERPEYRPKT